MDELGVSIVLAGSKVTALAFKVTFKSPLAF